MDLPQRARDLYAAGRMHDALEVAQAFCERNPKDAEGWSLLGRIARHLGMPGASDDAFRRAHELDRERPTPCRVSGKRFQALIGEARLGLSAGARAALAGIAVRTRSLPDSARVQAGLDPDALVARDVDAPGVVTLFQANHENLSADEDALRALVQRSLAALAGGPEAPSPT